MRTLHTIHEMTAWSEACRREGLKIGYVPTMGAFHDGHASLMRRARKECARVAVSLFVNPIQFSSGEDFDRYPRDLDNDVRLAAESGVDVLYVPSVAEMYPKGFATYVDQDDLPEKLCGPFRPGHFRGVMTVVTKLLCIVRPHVAYFGQKDYQQTLIVRRMATDLNMGVDVRVLPTVREEDGTAMSSRNRYLGPKQRKDAAILHKALKRAEDLIEEGENSSAKIIGEMRRVIRRVKGTKVDYIAIVNQFTLEHVKEIKGKILVALAVRIGNTRLIDNLMMG